MTEELPFDHNEFWVTGPLWVVVERNPPPGSAGYAYGRADGVEYLMVFTDRDLANRFVQHDDRLKTLVPGIVETPAQWLGLLELALQQGCTHVGFDPGPATPAPHRPRSSWSSRPSSFGLAGSFLQPPAGLSQPGAAVRGSCVLGPARPTGVTLRPLLECRVYFRAWKRFQALLCRPPARGRACPPAGLFASGCCATVSPWFAAVGTLWGGCRSQVSLLLVRAGLVPADLCPPYHCGLTPSPRVSFGPGCQRAVLLTDIILTGRLLVSIDTTRIFSIVPPVSRPGGLARC